MHLPFSSATSAVLLTLFGLDVLFIGMHFAASFSLSVGSTKVAEIFYGHFNLFGEEALPESYNYAKWGMATVLSFAAFTVSRQKVFLGVAFASAMFFLDDAGQVHEKMGALFHEFGMPGYGELDAASVGELAGFAGLGGLVFLGLGFAWIVAGRFQRKLLKVMLVAIVGMILCGGFVDILHNLIADNVSGWFVANVTGVIEDGGEMIFISLYSACAFSLALDAFRRTS